MQALEDARVAREQATQEAAKEAANRERALLDEREVLQQERETLQQELRESVGHLREIDATNAALDFESQVRRIKMNSNL
jgi:hypothetical protein